jgi:hypothetical protein
MGDERDNQETTPGGDEEKSSDDRNTPMTNNQETDGTNETNTNDDKKEKHNSNRDEKRSPYAQHKPLTYAGENEDVGVVLALRSERYSKKVVFGVFIEKMKNYVLQNFVDGKDMMPILDKLEDPKNDIIADQPKDLTNDEQRSEVMRWMKQEQVKTHIKRLTNLDGNKEKMYSIVWGQCSNALQEVIKTDDAFAQKDADFDCIWLLQKCKMAAAGVNDKANKHATLFQSILHFCTIKQSQYESNDSFRKRLDSAVLTLELAGGKHILVSDVLLKAADIDNPSPVELDIEEEKFKAMVLIMRADPYRYNTLQSSLEEGVLLGRDEYPRSVTAAYDLLQNTCPELPGGGNKRGGRFSRFRRGRNKNAHGSHVSFAQATSNSGDKSSVPGKDGKVFAHIKCHNCGKYGHYANQCTEARKPRAQFTQFVLTQKDHEIIDKSWILLDTCSTVSVCCNKSLVSNIVPCTPNDELTIVTNGGTQVFDNTADLNLLPLRVHFNEHSLANILSLSDVANLPGARVTMDTDIDRAIILHFNGKTLRFHECADGLYFFDTKSLDRQRNSKNLLTQYSTNKASFIQSVKSNKEFFTKREIDKAQQARNLQSKIGWPSNSGFKTIIRNNLLINSGITVDDVNRAELIFGIPTPLLKGKMTRSNPISNQAIKRVPLPLPIQQEHSHLDLFADFFFVNKIPFLHTKSGNINFLTADNTKSRGTKSIIHTLSSVHRLYSTRGFHIDNIHADNEFNIPALHDALLPTNFRIYATGEHVGAIERSVRTVKERCRSICHTLPYRKFTKLMTIRLIDTAIFWLNAFPSKNGVSDFLSPSSIVQGHNKPDFNHKTIVFGSYAMVFVGTQNNMKARSVPAIALGPSNEWGGHYFMSLFSGKRLHSYNWHELPIDDAVIDRVHELADIENQPPLIDGMPIFEWSIGDPIADNDDNDDDQHIEHAAPPEHALDNPLPAAVDPIPAPDPYVTDSEADDDSIPPPQPHHDDMHSVQSEERDGGQNPILIEDDFDDFDAINNLVADAEKQLDQELDEIGHINNLNTNEYPLEIDETSIDTIDEPINNSNDTEDSNQMVEETSENPDPPVLNNRPRRTNAGAGVERLVMDMKGKDYLSYKHKQFMMKSKMNRTKKNVILTMMQKKGQNANNSNMLKRAVGIMFQQMSAKKGIRTFGERAIAAMIKEFQQLDQGAVPGKPVVDPVDPTTISHDEKRQALEAVNLIKEKRCGRIKGRTCANGSKQRQFLKEGESVASPTVSLEALLATLMVDVYEGRDVATFDVPGAYLHAEMPKDKRVLMILRGEFVDIMCEVNPKYKKFVQEINGKKVLYLKVLRALYGCIESALLWYDLFANTLQKEGFKINPYDKCVANKTINGSQCTIVWYVDDVKVSHQDEKEVTNIIEKVEEHFGKVVTVRGRSHCYLGMNILLRDDKKIEIEMKDQINEAINAFGEEIKGEVSSPAARHLMTVNENAKKLNAEQKDIFHSITAKLLYLEKRARPDIEPVVAFLCTRVRDADEDDWKKLKRVLVYLKQSINDKRIIGCDGLENIFTWIDAAFAVHPNMRSHTGGAMSLGWGVLHTKSSKQKLTTKSSTEAEVVGLSEYVPYNIWLINFLGEQGYKIKENIIYQDNESAIKMEKNGRNSCTGNSRHISIRYFFVKDRVDKGEMKIEHCPTYKMLADFFTKPLQGKAFKAYKDVIMGYKHMKELHSLLPSSMKERVGKGDQNWSQ